MSSLDPRSWTDRLVEAAVGLLVAALALKWALIVLASIWVALVIIGAVLLSLIVAVHLWRGNRRGW